MASHMVAKSVLATRSACTAPPGGVGRALLRHTAGTALLQGAQYHRRQAAAAGQPSRQRRLVAVSVAAPAAAGPHASPVYGGEMNAAVEAVRLASRLCQAVQVQLQRGEKTEKDDESPVTVADYGAQALVAWSLQRSFPGQAVSLVAEEDAVELRAPEGADMLARIAALVNEALAVEHPQAAPLSPSEVADLIDSGNSAGGGSGRHWVLDPIDGTRGFVGMRQYAVCLGLLEQGEVVLGVLGCPNLPQYAISEADCDEGQAGRSFSDEAVGTMFAACKDQGSWAGPVFGGMPSQRIFCNDTLPASQVRYMESFEARHSNHDMALAIADEIGITLPSLRLDSQAKYGALSRGDASVFMRFPDPSYREKIWDHCAGVIILQEAGAVISDAAGHPLDFSKGRYFPDLHGGIVAATPSMHRAIIAAIQKIRGGSS
ncbi:hypothetical protein COHA_004954 [Chlorella ohadii]|uniref:3'(2'),5'-bisphosphate nucleotidase n=1 Tax=Chlorella ohadii TaxID=2649997 RepID=A0AAD5DS81_9CHLO|nr:hypothetical protein COHA_004954 [Chlorella ohadii]